MPARFVTKTVHAYLDHPVALSLFELPFILGVGADNPWARWLSPVTGVIFIIATFALGFQGLDMSYYLANAVAVLLVATMLNAPETTARPALPLPPVTTIRIRVALAELEWKGSTHGF